jgi:hypothetical protein
MWPRPKLRKGQLRTGPLAKKPRQHRRTQRKGAGQITCKGVEYFVQRCTNGALHEDFSERVETGRVWGVWNEYLLPVQWERVRVSLGDAYKIRRIYRRLAKIKEKRHLSRLTVSVRHENVVRLLELLGYHQEE